MKEVYFLNAPPFDNFIVGNYIIPAHLELIKLYCKN
jgi:hypothetical protein